MHTHTKLTYTHERTLPRSTILNTKIPFPLLLRENQEISTDCHEDSANNAKCSNIDYTEDFEIRINVEQPATGLNAFEGNRAIVLKCEAYALSNEVFSIQSVNVQVG